jgi:tRNA threonylcarbamoyladenosine biosynthesis protein TsaB
MGVLAIDTAGPVIGMAFDEAERTERVTRGAEGRLIPWALELTGGLERIELIVVSVGPGAFTGVRVGMAHAEGLAHALQVPLVGVGSLVGRGQAVDADLALLDARKQRVYAGWAADGYRPVDAPIADVLADGAARGLVPPGFRAIGEGALVCREAIEAAGGMVVSGADHPHPASLGRVGAARYRADPALGRQPVLPDYIRPPDAVPPRRGV